MHYRENENGEMVMYTSPGFAHYGVWTNESGYRIVEAKSKKEAKVCLMIDVESWDDAQVTLLEDKRHEEETKDNPEEMMFTEVSHFEQIETLDTIEATLEQLTGHLGESDVTISYIQGNFFLVTFNVVVESAKLGAFLQKFNTFEWKLGETLPESEMF